MLVIGLTGGIGSGKSTVANLLQGHGAIVIDVDALGRVVIAPGGRAEQAVINEFGDGIVTDGVIDRAKLAEVVFADGAALDRLTAISHPAINAELSERLGELPHDSVAVLDMAILVESNLGRGMYSTVITVEAPLALRVDRAVARGMKRADVEARLAAQASDDQRRVVADIVIVNDGDLDTLKAAVAATWQRLTA